jgi:hypothetical protein
MVDSEKEEEVIDGIRWKKEVDGQRRYSFCLVHL